MNRSGWIGKVLLGLAVLVPVVGFAVSIYLAASGNSLTIFSSNDSPASEPYVLTATDFPGTSDTGNQVGYQVPAFTMELADGSEVMSAGLVEQGRPTYLFFWATV